MDNTLESLLRYLDTSTGLDRLSTPYWLIIVMVAFLVATIFSELFEKQNDRRTLETRYRLRTVGLILTGLSTLFTLSAWCLSYYSGYYYNFYVVLGLLAQMTSSLVLSLTWSSLNKSKKTMLVEKALLHLNAITIIFVVSGRWLIRGVDAEETSADTLNIFYNGGFRYSMHAGWYDLAPIDSILKVILLWINGNNNPFSPYESFLISFVSGLFLYIVMLAYVKSRQSMESLAFLVPALLLVHPYAPLTGIYITPTNISTGLALSAMIILLKSSAREPSETVSTVLLMSLMITASTLSHPFSISTLIFLAIYVVLRRIEKQDKTIETTLLIITALIWAIKTVYTATVHGVLSTLRMIIEGILTLWERESPLVFRNVGYAQLPRLSLASFTASLGVLYGLTLVVLFKPDRGVLANTRWVRALIVIYTSLTGISSVIAALGGYSRYVFVPFATLLPLPFMIYFSEMHVGRALKIIIMLISVLTIVSPNFMSDQYSIPFVAKFTDEGMFRKVSMVYDLLDPVLIIDVFQYRSSIRPMLQQESKFVRNVGEPGHITDKMILRRIINARTYWDLVGRRPLDYSIDSLNNLESSLVLNFGHIKVYMVKDEN